jgi:dephospho-CoA kinase
MVVVGLTGGIGTGKTTVAGLLGARGAEVVDCDGLGRLVVEPGGRAHAAVVDRFGPAVVRPDGTLDRPALARIVFNDPAALAELNGLTHPAIDAEIAERIAGASSPVVVLDMAVLVETTLGAGQYDVVLVVEAPLALRLARLAERGVERADAEARIASQASDEQRRAVADHVLCNDGDLAHLERQVDALWPRLRTPDPDRRS